MGLSLVKHEAEYRAVQQLSTEKNYHITILCGLLGIHRSAYYKWLHREKSQRERENEKLMEQIKEAYEERDGILGYRQMTLKIRRESDTIVNHKRVYRLMQVMGLKSVCRRKRKVYIKSTPQITAENKLNRDFHAKQIHEKWLTDVTELKYGNGQKAYLSAILDLGDRSIVSYVLGKSNNNALVFHTFDKAVSNYPEAKPLFHSDRGFQYTSKIFKEKLNQAGMVQSMSRVGRCIDNGPMEGFFAIFKTEMFHLYKFSDFESLESAIDDYMDYYNNQRYQKRLNGMTPMEYRHYLIATVA
ncbi:IS3 family transposase [Chengkuizengella marina]|uniref:IS3 family transposase n=1 Tax=Chengkuizengella marina TaxID=2507566 RepID=A0A6N9Q8C3_9BACL|nr:IS3 family transposase [Chengkuizengella marina]NBI31165.1 IS3 family transposase [Chengkuizengella marina]